MNREKFLRLLLITILLILFSAVYSYSQINFNGNCSIIWSKRGCNPPYYDRYCPQDKVMRAQIAAFIYRAFLR